MAVATGDAPSTPGLQPNSEVSTNGSTRTRERGRGRGRAGRNQSLNFRPATVAPAAAVAEVSSADNSASENQAKSTRDRRNRGDRAPQSRTVGGRAFGGRLTQQGGTIPGALQADAAVFIPGNVASNDAVSVTSSRPPKRQPRNQKRRFSKSQAPDIATRTHEDINNGLYECPICTSEVQRNSKVWSCHTCWTVFHLTCIKKWSQNEGSAAAQQNLQNGETPALRQWRCPGCNLPKDVLPNTYSCWCGKETEPRSTAGIPPHSCGNTCARERARKCPHPCQLTCHAGPCPPCTHMGPTQMCFCGKHEVKKRCSDTNYDTGWSCGELCGEILPCGEHGCPRPCHEGLCGACEVRVPARCYCGQIEKDVLCSDRGEERQSQLLHPSSDNDPVMEYWTGSFQCGNLCNRLFDCGVHRCEKMCHHQDGPPSHCPRSSDIVTHCSCGKTPLSQLSNRTREKCDDPIPSCSKPCGRVLSCGHECKQICHSGNCLPCLQTVDIACRCGRTTSKTICHQGVEEPPQCMRMCRATLNCGRHACDERCCTGEKKASQRQSSKRKQRPLHTAPRPFDDGFEAEHICTRQCSRLLTCGSHICTDLCHKGPCSSCREAIFDEVSCHCGRTVLQPPLPCGTQPPPCRFPCARPKPCGHPQVVHNCHQDAESCPKCPFLMEKRCMCGKQTLKNQQCWLQDVRCGQVCGKKLRCGSHFCTKPCHRAGECEDADGKACTQACGKPKKACGHPDDNVCHAPYACKEEKPCQSKIFITCDCQAQKQEMKCLATKSSSGNNGKSLPCNDECARLERNRRLALALNIDRSAHVDGGDHIPYSAETINQFAENVKWAQEQEREFRVFATSDNEKRLRFKPMKPHHRSFVHALATDFGFDSESVDPEPHRHVMIWKTPRFVSAPNKTLAECLRLRQARNTNPGSANVSDAEGAMKRSKASNLVGEPYNSFVISSPRFGLTVDELRTELNSLIHPTTPLQFSIDFLPSEEVVLRATSSSLNSYDLQTTLQNIKPQLTTALAAKAYGTAQLCTTDNSLNIIRRESDHPSGDGWSRVAAKKAAPRITIQNESVGPTNSFSALLGDGKVTFAKKKAAKPKKVAEPVADDWETAEMAEEEREKSAVNSANEEEQGQVEKKDAETGPMAAPASVPTPVPAPSWDEQVVEEQSAAQEETT